MRLFTLDSDKKFFIYFFMSLVILVAGFYFYVESKVQNMASKKMDDPYINFTQALRSYRFDLVIMGTSHSNRIDLLGNPLTFNLSAPHNIPTVMYFRAKTIIKFHPEVKAVYLEADDHLFFNGTYYNLDGFDPVQKRESKIFLWNAAYIDADDEKEKVFGSVAPYSKDRLMLLANDVKPVIIKQILRNFISGSTTSTNAEKSSVNDSNNLCNLSGYQKQVSLDQDSEWSKRSLSDQTQRMTSRISEHHLDTPGPLKDIQIEYFERTIHLLKNHNIEVVLMLNPGTNAFVSLKNPEGQKLYKEYIHNLAQKYQLRILDMNDLSHYGDRLFEDQDHIGENFGWLIGKHVMEDFCNSKHSLHAAKTN